MKRLLDTARALCNKKPSIEIDGILFTVIDGDLDGESLIFMENKGDKHVFFAFISFPEFHIREIPKKDFIIGLKTGIVQKVGNIPPEIAKFIKTQYLMRA